MAMVLEHTFDKDNAGPSPSFSLAVGQAYISIRRFNEPNQSAIIYLDRSLDGGTNWHHVSQWRMGPDGGIMRLGDPDYLLLDKLAATEQIITVADSSLLWRFSVASLLSGNISVYVGQG